MRPLRDTPPIDRVFLETTDFEELQDAASGWDQQYFQMSPGPFAGRIDMTTIGSRQIFRECWSRNIRYEGTAPPGAYGVALRLDRAGPARVVGTPFDTDSVVFQAPGHEADLLTPEGWDVFALSIPEDEVRTIFDVLSGGAEAAPEAHAVVDLTPAAANRLRRLALRFLHASAHMTRSDTPRIARFSDMVVKSFLWEVVGARGSDSLVRVPSRPNDLVGKATDLVLAHPHEVMGLTDICAALGISLRALHYAFQDATGMSPATWLRRVRLNRVHKALVQAGPGDVLVKQVAIDNGFLHQGHFTRHYQSHFGRLPTETLLAA